MVKATYLRLALHMRTHPRLATAEMRHPTEVAALHTSKLERAAANRVERAAGDAVDAVVEDDRVRRPLVEVC